MVTSARAVTSKPTSPRTHPRSSASRPERSVMRSRMHTTTDSHRPLSTTTPDKSYDLTSRGDGELVSSDGHGSVPFRLADTLRLVADIQIPADMKPADGRFGAGP